MSSSSVSLESSDLPVLPIRFLLNGTPVESDAADPHTSLLAFVRGRGLTGSKEGCAEGECGACAVVVVRPDDAGEGSRYEALNACLLPLPAAHGAEVWTVEGIGTPQSPHPVQAALTRGGSQCGYCTPGFVASLFAEYHRQGRDGIDEEALGGNLCRCTGYRPIREAAHELGPAGDGPFAARLAAPAPVPAPVRHEANGRVFLRPGTLGELVALRRDLPGALLLAGGTDAMVESNLRGRRWDAVISVEAVPDLRAVTWTDDAVEIGAALDLKSVERALGGRVPLLAELLPLFASPLVRARATLGGNLATASPIGDAAPCLLALGAGVRLVSALGEREVPLASFFAGYRATVMRADEVLASVRVPLPLPGVQRFYKTAKRGRDDISTVAAAVALDLQGDGTVRAARLGLGGVAATPARAEQTEAFLVGQPFTADVARRAGEVLAREFAPISDARGSALYRTAVLRGVLPRLHAELAGEVLA